ncbi:MAG: insulinase family protein [Candidatus Obscuribacterales bacterium]|nr:insulinase family protein [Candidatus Obscuribacterales bacterium]
MNTTRRLSIFRGFLVSLLISASLPLGSISASPALAAIQKPLIPVTRDFKLTNGLRVLLSEDHSVPVAALAIVYDVGARDERKGRSGFAHFFEHMMFQGSDNVGKMEHMKYIEGVGGSLNASTHPDFTNYFEKVPSNQMELCLWLESDRMRSLKVTPQSFQNQLETVKEEKRSRIDNQPYVPAAIRLEERLYDNWANSHAVIGTFDDLNASSVEDIKEFFKTYYAPNNAVMAIVGDFDAAEMQKLVEKYFSSIPSVPTPARSDLSEPGQKSPKLEKMEDKHAQLPAFWLGWKAPGRRDPDYYALQIVEKLLSAGDSSRLYQRMIKGDQVALKVEAGYDERRGPSAFEAFIVYKPGNSTEKVKEIFWSEIDKLKNSAVPAEELEKARNQILRNYFSGSSYNSLQRSLGKAELLAEYTSFFGDPKYLDDDIEAVMKVNADDVQRVAKKYLTKESITVIDIEPAAEKAKPAKS